MESPLGKVPDTFYKPLATRTSILFTYLLLTLTLLILTEHACRQIPQHDGLGKLSTAVDHTLAALQPRSDDDKQNLHVFVELGPQLNRRSSATNTSQTILVGTPSEGNLNLGTTAPTPSASTSSKMKTGPHLTPDGGSWSTTTTFSPNALVTGTPSSARNDTTWSSSTTPILAQSSFTTTGPRISPSGGSPSTTQTAPPSVTVVATFIGGPRTSPSSGSTGTTTTVSSNAQETETLSASRLSLDSGSTRATATAFPNTPVTGTPNATRIDTSGSSNTTLARAQNSTTNYFRTTGQHLTLGDGSTSTTLTGSPNAQATGTPKVPHLGVDSGSSSTTPTGSPNTQITGAPSAPQLSPGGGSSSTTPQIPISIQQTFTRIGGFLTLGDGSPGTTQTSRTFDVPSTNAGPFLTLGGGSPVTAPNAPTTVQQTVTGTGSSLSLSGGSANTALTPTPTSNILYILTVGLLNLGHGSTSTIPDSPIIRPTVMGYAVPSQMAPSDVVLTSIAITKLSIIYSSSTEIGGNVVVIASTIPSITTEVVLTTISPIYHIVTLEVVLTSVAVTELSTILSTSMKSDGQVLVLASTIFVTTVKGLLTTISPPIATPVVVLTKVAMTILSTSFYTSTKADGNVVVLPSTVPVTKTEAVLTTISPSIVTPVVTLTSVAITILSTSFYTSTEADGSVVVLTSAIPITTTEAIFTTLSPSITIPGVVLTTSVAVTKLSTSFVTTTEADGSVVVITSAIAVVTTEAVQTTVLPSITTPGVVLTTSVAITKRLTSLYTTTEADGSVVVLTRTIAVVTTEAVLTTISPLITTPGVVLTSIAITKLSTSFYTSTRKDESVVVLASTIPFTTTEAVWATTSPIYPVSTTVNSSGTYIFMSDGTAHIPPQIDLEQYIVVEFLPMILALVLTLPWRIIDKTIREMEPFYHLQHSSGVSAEKSLLLDYPMSLLITLPFKAINRGHYFVLLSSIVSLALLMIAPLSSEVLFVSLSGDCDPDATGVCNATWGIYSELARAIEGILASIAFLLVVMIAFNFRRKSGVYANPLSIAGLGTLFQNPDTLQEFAALDSRLDNRALKDALAGRVYRLAMMTSRDGSSSYGIARMRSVGEPRDGSSYYGSGRGECEKADVSDNSDKDFVREPPSEYVEKISRWTGVTEKLLQGGIFVLISGTFIIMIYYHWTSSDTGFERFMDSRGFGVRFFMAVLGVGVKTCWLTIDDDLRRLEPYRRLLRGSAKPEDSILVHAYMSPLSSLIPSLRHRHFLVFTVSLTAILAELLPISFANTPYNRATVLEAYTIFPLVAIAILGLMLVSLAVIIIRPDHGLKRLPRTPKTIASVLLYLATQPSCQYGGMMGSLAGLESMTESEMRKSVVGMGRSYGLGSVICGDLRIEEEDKIQRT